jgi:hypothetical protein
VVRVVAVPKIDLTMKRFSLVLITTLLGALALCGDSWQSFRSADGSYSVNFPGKPMVKRGVQNFQGHKVPTETAIYGKGYRAYVVLCMDIGAAVPQARGRERDLLRFGVSAFTAGKGYKVFSDDAFEMNGHPGRHVVLHKSGVEEQFYAVAKDGQMFAIIVGGLPGKTVDQEANKFIASFKLN